MRTLDPDYLSHISSGATTLCTCWLLVRKDGQTLGFTDHDHTVRFDGQNFEPSGGFDGAERPSSLGGQTDTGDVLGILTSDAITADDIELGKYDDARIETFRVNWRDTSIRNKQRVDTIGEIIREDTQFRAELRSPEEQLNIPKGRRYSHLCDARLGDSRCSINLDQSQFKMDATIVANTSRHSITVSGGGVFDTQWFDHGTATWASGKRTGIIDRIVSHTLDGTKHVLIFAEPVGDWLALGDQAHIFAGCDRSFSQCQAKFANSANFRGFPHIPGRDAIMRYPLSTDSFAGRPLVK